MKQKITVTQACIDNGFRANPNRCPVALALRVYFPEAQVSAASWGTDRRTVLYNPSMLPLNVKDFITSFDAGMNRSKIKPFSFYVEVTK